MNGQWELEGWEREITMEDIPGQYWYIADAIGVEGFIKLVRCAGGQPSIYVPKIDKMMASIRNRHIAKEYNGYNLSALAVKYNLTVAQVRNILRGEENEGGGQMSIFDM